MSNMIGEGSGSGSSASAANRSVTETENIQTSENPTPVLRLQLTKPKNQKKVVWNADTVDNEHMNKKKSKCCCIYKKPTVFGESSSESEDECEHCFGHPEKRKKDCSNPNHNHDCSDLENDSNPTTTSLPIETNQ